MGTAASPTSSPRRRRLGALALAVALLALSAGVAYGTGRLIVSPDADGTIHACYGKRDGHMRIVSAEGRCRRKERALSWSTRPTAPPPPPAPAPAPPPPPAPAPSPDPGAFAHVNRDGTLDAARSQGIDRISHTTDTGLYCFDLAAPAKNIVVTNEGFFGGTSATHISATVTPPETGQFACPEGFRDAAVLTLSDRPFYVLFR